MRQTIKVNDLTTLFVCPSGRWGTLERRALADSVYFRDIGGNSILFCLKGSYIDAEAQRQDIPTIYYTGKKVNRFFDLSYLLDMHKILLENRFNIIHCYDLNYVWYISLLLKTNSEVPLFLTLNNLFKKHRKNIFHKWLFRRIDHVVTFCNSTSRLVNEYLPVSLRKIKVTGGGIEVSNKHNNQLNRVLNKPKQDNTFKKIGTFINLGGKYYKAIETLLYAIKPLVNAVEDLSIKLEFYFYSDTDWPLLRHYPRIQEKLEELGIAKFVYFKKTEKRELALQQLDILVGSSFEEPFNDLEIMALMYFIPVVVPRTAFRQETLTTSKFIGESYLQYDSRELKDKLLKILVNEQVYRAEILENHEKITFEHGMDTYSERITKLYELNFTKRLRVSYKQQK